MSSSLLMCTAEIRIKQCSKKKIDRRVQLISNTLVNLVSFIPAITLTELLLLPQMTLTKRRPSPLQMVIRARLQTARIRWPCLGSRLLGAVRQCTHRAGNPTPVARQECLMYPFNRPKSLKVALIRRVVVGNNNNIPMFKNKHKRE